MILRIMVCSLLALNTANAVAGNNYIYKDKDKGSQVVVTNINPSGDSSKSSKKVRVKYYSDSTNYSSPKKADREKYINMALKEVSPSIDAKKVDRDIAERAKYLAMADE